MKKIKVISFIVFSVLFGAGVVQAQNTTEERWRNILWEEVIEPFIVDCYPVDVYRLDARQEDMLRSFYERVKDEDFSVSQILIIGYADGVVQGGLDVDEVNYPIAKKRAFFAKQFLVNIGLPGRDIQLESQHTYLEGCEHRKVVLILRKYKTLDQFGVDGRALSEKERKDLAHAAVEQYKHDQEKKELSDEDLAKLRDQLKDDIARALASDQDFRDELAKGLPEPVYKKLRPRDITLGGVYFQDFGSDYGKGGLGAASISITLFDWLLLRPWGAIGGSDLGFTFAGALRLEALLTIKDQNFRFITGGAYRGFNPSRISGDTDADHWYIPFGFGWDFHKYGYLNILSGYGSTARTVDEEGNLRFEDEDLTDPFFDFSVELGIRIPLTMWQEEDE